MLIHAAELATSYAHDYVGVEHAVLAIRNLSEEHPAQRVLSRLALDLPSFWRMLEHEARVTISRPAPAVLPHTPRLQHVLRIAFKLARSEKQPEVTILHFLTSVAVESNSLVAFVFRSQLKEATPDYSEYDRVAALMTVQLRRPEAKTLEEHRSNQHNVAS